MRTAINLLWLLPCAVSAHHSRIEFLGGEIHEIEGEVLTVFWQNPHAHFSVRADDGEIWDVESADIVTLNRRGVPADTVRVGDRIKVAGIRSARRDNILDVTNVLANRGTEVIFRPGGAPRWTDAVVGAVDGEPARRAAAATDGAGIFRVWTRTQTNLPELDALPLTEAARAAYAAFDPLVDDPVLTCTTPGMPRSMTFTGPHPIEFIDADTEIELRLEYFDSMRTIHMGETANADGQPASPMGYSVGRWEGDALVVTTTRVSWPYFDLNAPLLGFPQTEAVEIVERFELRDDGNELAYDITVTDPGTFTEPLALTDYLIWRAVPGIEIESFDCVVNPDLTER